MTRPPDETIIRVDLGPNREGRAVTAGARADLIERPRQGITREDDFVAWR